MNFREFTRRLGLIQSLIERWHRPAQKAPVRGRAHMEPLDVNVRSDESHSKKNNLNAEQIVKKNTLNEAKS